MLFLEKLVKSIIWYYKHRKQLLSWLIFYLYEFRTYRVWFTWNFIMFLVLRTINFCMNNNSFKQLKSSNYLHVSNPRYITCNLFWQFINHLINQLARHQFLKIACQLEKKNMLGAYSLVKVIESELQAYVSATKGRVVYIIILSFWVLFSLSPSLRSFFCFGTYIYIWSQLSLTAIASTWFVWACRDRQTLTHTHRHMLFEV